MQSLFEQNSLSRKMGSPWYGTTPVCLLVGVLMLLVSLFAWVGVGVAGAKGAWVPVTLLCFSVAILIRIGFCLLKRGFQRFRKDTL